MPKIAIVEDDELTRRELATLLETSEYEPILITEFDRVEKSILDAKPDLVLLDINIPYMNGKAVLADLRKTSNVPVIMVTSKNSDVEEALSISYGADDYITKPYNPNILLLRIGAVLKRMDSTQESFYGDIRIDLNRGILKNTKNEIVLTKNEMIIFGCLLSHRGHIVTRDELMTALWDNSEYINDNALTVNISRLRTKLATLGAADAIDTKKGIGYILL